jgi:hypothetical protein
LLAVMGLSGYQRGSLYQTDIDIYIYVCVCVCVYVTSGFLWCSQSGDDPQEEDLAKSGYKLSTKVKLLKHWSIFWLHSLTCIEETWRFFFFFFRIMAIGNPKRQLIFSTLYYFVYNFLAIFFLPSTAFMALFFCVVG